MIFCCLIVALDTKLLTDQIKSDWSFSWHPQKTQLLIIMGSVLIGTVFLHTTISLTKLDSHEVPRSFLWLGWMILYSAAYIGLEYKGEKLIECIICVGMFMVFILNIGYVSIV